MRPRQWPKNALVIAAPLAASILDDAEAIIRTTLAVFAFTAASAAVYLINDSVDVDVDRAHPTKRHRPIAAREVDLRTAAIAATVLAAVSLAVGFGLNPWFGLVLAAYLALNLGYSRGLKHVAYLEMGIVASGFILRGIGGATANDIGLSAWFVLVVCAGSTFVVSGKRSAELARTQGVGGRTVLDRYRIKRLRGIRAVAAATAVVAYALWVLQTNDAIGWLSTASLFMFAAALARYSDVIEAGQGEDPEDVFLRDRQFQLIGLGWLIVYAGAVYG